MSGIARHHTEWLNLIERSGPFVEPPVLTRAFPQGLPKIDGKKLGRLRAAYEEWANAQDAKASDASALHATWVQLVLGELLEFDDQTLRAADSLPSGLEVRLAEYHETLRPSMAIVEPGGRAKAGTPRLLIAVWPSDQDLESAVPTARWAASPLERMTQLCRSTGVRLGLVTNGERWTVVDAPVGQTAGYASWYAGLWLQEPITVAAFDALLGVRRFFNVADTDTIEALLDESVAFQQEVTDQLGYQVRRAVEVLVQALDRADLDRKRELLRDVPPARLYDAALTVMMRLVFLFCAEERGLLLLGDETYDANYAVSTLRALLREEADRVGVEVLERRQDAWARLLATFRAVHGGVEHEALRLPALGGSLFDPDRFPFLEGRAAGTSWLDTPASPLPIDNRTVLHLLEALQLLRTRGDGGTSEARKLSYRALDIEQIGHVYEGLLDHVAVRVDADTLGLSGTKDKEPELSLDELNRERRHGRDGLIEFLKEHTGRSTSALRSNLDAEPDEVGEQRLLVACGNDKALVRHIAPYHALIRNDVWGYPQIYRAGSFMVTGGSERRQTGTHYTPKSLTEQIVTETLKPLVYVGPAEGKPRDAWKLRSAAELLDLKICDMAMGSGAFLVQVCRWLAERVVEAWEEAERQGTPISADGEVLEKAAGRDLLPRDREERLSFARRLVAERCIYGVDINPMAVELAKQSLWLVTLAKGRPFAFLDHNLRCGDSLLGVTSIAQLEHFHLDPAVGKELHYSLLDPREEIREPLREAMELRNRLRLTRIVDIGDVQMMARLDGNAKAALGRPELIGDLLIGAAVGAAGRSPKAFDQSLIHLSAEIARWLSNGAIEEERLKKRARDLLDLDGPQRLTPRRPFHWALEYPEVFAEGRGGFDAVVGNPPFAGGSRSVEVFGDRYTSYLVERHPGLTKKTDLCCHFFRRASALVHCQGGIGLVGTNTITQGASRRGSLETILRERPIVYALSGIKWPGPAQVTVVVVVFGPSRWQGTHSLNGTAVGSIDGLLTAGSHGAPKRLAGNAKVCFIGVHLGGTNGFIVPAALAKEWIERDERNRHVLFPFISGDNLGASPLDTVSTWVIGFGEMDQDEAASYREPFSHLEKNVKPERARKNADKYPRMVYQWWKFWHSRNDLYADRTAYKSWIVRARVTSHHALRVCPSNWMHTDMVVVFKLERFAEFALLQSVVHEVWAQRFSSSLGEAPRYIPTDCFATFPRPSSFVHEAELVGKEFHDTRQRWLTRNGVGLTRFSRTLNTQSGKDTDIESLRELRVRMDAVIARSYGWDDLSLDHDFRAVDSLPEADRVRYTVSDDVRRDIVRRLTDLNDKRHREEIAE